MKIAGKEKRLPSYVSLCWRSFLWLCTPSDFGVLFRRRQFLPSSSAGKSNLDKSLAVCLVDSKSSSAGITSTGLDVFGKPWISRILDAKARFWSANLSISRAYRCWSFAILLTSCKHPSNVAGKWSTYRCLIGLSKKDGWGHGKCRPSFYAFWKWLDLIDVELIWVNL